MDNEKSRRSTGTRPYQPPGEQVSHGNTTVRHKPCRHSTNYHNIFLSRRKQKQLRPDSKLRRPTNINTFMYVKKTTLTFVGGSGVTR